MNKNNQISTRCIAIILFNDSLRYTLLLRAIIDKYPETFFMNSVIKMRSNRGYFAREEIRFPAVISIDRRRGQGTMLKFLKIRRTSNKTRAFPPVLVCRASKP